MPAKQKQQSLLPFLNKFVSKPKQLLLPGLSPVTKFAYFTGKTLQPYHIFANACSQILVLEDPSLQKDKLRLSQLFNEQWNQFKSNLPNDNKVISKAVEAFVEQVKTLPNQSVSCSWNAVATKVQEQALQALKVEIPIQVPKVKKPRQTELQQIIDSSKHQLIQTSEDIRKLDDKTTAGAITFRKELLDQKKKLEDAICLATKQLNKTQKRCKYTAGYRLRKLKGETKSIGRPRIIPKDKMEEAMKDLQGMQGNNKNN